MHNLKKILAGTLAATMILGSSFAALADEGNLSGDGQLDVVEKEDIFQVVLPSVDENTTTFDYILDPKGVINETNAEKYGGATFESGKTVYFQNVAAQGDASGGAVDASGGAGTGVHYSDLSDELTAYNKSTMPVTIAVNAKVKDVPANITMVTSNSFNSNDNAASLYLALKSGSTEQAITADGTSIGGPIAILPNAYETKYDQANDKYVKALKDEYEDDTDSFPKYSFQLTGACNPNGEWVGLTDTPPEVEVVWTIEDPTATPTGPQVSISPSGTISITNLDGDLYDHMTFTDNGVETTLRDSMGTWDHWEVAENGRKQFTFNSDWTGGYFTGRTVVVTVHLTDGNTIVSSTVTMS